MTPTQSIDPAAHQIVQDFEYRGLPVSVQRKDGPRCPYYRAIWSYEDGSPMCAADAWTTTQTMACADAKRAIDRHLDKTTDHFSLADRLAEEEAGAARECDRFE